VNAKIAVFMKEIKNDVSYQVPLTVRVFEKRESEWVKLGYDYVNLSANMDLPSVRQEIMRLLDSLGNCRIAAGTEITGVLYRELDSHGYAVFEIDDCSPDTLDGILRDLDETIQAADGTGDVPRKPVETETPGVYFMDLNRLQESYPDMSSKQALREFLESTPFYELKIACAHLPPWLENGPYDISEEKTGVSVMATIRKKQCRGG
jgi:hypothetical protein